MNDTPFDQLTARLRAQFGTSIDPLLATLGGLLDRGELVPRREFEQALEEVAALRSVVADLESQLATLSAAEDQPPPGTSDKAADD